jgi:hypothetical protein
MNNKNAIGRLKRSTDEPELPITRSKFRPSPCVRGRDIQAQGCDPPDIMTIPAPRSLHGYDYVTFKTCVFYEHSQRTSLSSLEVFLSLSRHMTTGSSFKNSNLKQLAAAHANYHELEFTRNNYLQLNSRVLLPADD